MTKPEAKTGDLVIQNTRDETLVYDLRENRAHSLNRSMAIIWNNCDGKKDNNMLAKIVSKELGTVVNQDFISVALADLENLRLIKPLSNDFHLEGVTRRKVLLDYALPAAIIPAIVSLRAPVAAQANSCATRTCTTDADCTDPSRPLCLSNCCSAPPFRCNADTDCQDPSFPNCDTNTGMCIA